MKSSQVLLGILGGIAVGAVAGILFAPDKGSKTRKRVMQKGNDYANSLKNKFDEAQSTMLAKYDSAVDEARAFKANYKQR